MRSVFSEVNFEENDMFYIKVFFWWKNGTTSEFITNADSCLDAEHSIIDTFSGSVRDNILSYYSEIVDREYMVLNDE
jgi:hypothetical protein